MNKDVYGDEVIHSSDTGYKNTPKISQDTTSQ